VLRIALLTPLTPERTALADVIEGYLPELARRFELTVVTSGAYKPTAAIFRPEAGLRIRVLPYTQYRTLADQFDLALYNLGDEPRLHGYMLDAMQERAGVLLLHDLVLHHSIFVLTWGAGNQAAYRDELVYSYGAETAEAIIAGVLAGDFERLASRYPLVERVLDRSLAAAVFNAGLAEAVASLAPGLPIETLPLPFYLPGELPDEARVQALRRQIGSPETVIFGTFGLFNSQKRLELTLEAYQRLRREINCAYVLVGSALDPDLTARLNERNLLDDVVRTGWLEPAAFSEYMYAVDAAVQLRYPHVGGIPYTPIRLLGLGVPTIISDIAPQADLPSDAVIRIVPEASDEGEALYRAMYRLAVDPMQRASMSAASRVYIARQHDPRHGAARLADFVEYIAAQKEQLAERAQLRQRERTAGRKSGNDVVAMAGQALAAMGVRADDTEVLHHVLKPIAAMARLAQPRGEG